MPTDVQRIQAVFLAAADLGDPANRARFLDGACDGDKELRSRVEALLRAHDHADSLLDHPAVAAPDPYHKATQALTGPPDPGVAAGQTTGGDNGASDDEPLTFLAPPTRSDALGRIGHYEVLQVVGRGGFGIVFRAFDEVLQRVVALKVMAPHLATTSPARKRFLREARSSAQVRHENVVQVYEVAEQPLPYLAMEFIPGETLQQRLDRTGPLDVPEVLRVGRQIAEGLAAAHATDLIHRDIKPGNVLLEDGQQKVKITDFGLARAADDASISRSGIIAGTPMYMAPEQAKGEKLDQRADLFSLGSVLYQMVAGRPPFRANGTVAVLKRVAEDTPRDIREIIPEAPQWLCDIIAKLHAKDPGERYQSAHAVADVLADCEAQLKAHTRLKDYSRIPQGKPRRSRRWKWAAAAVTIALLPVIALVGTEAAGVTHLFRAQPGTSEPSKSGSDSQSEAGPAWHGWPADAPPLAIAPFDAAQAGAYQEAWAKYLGVPVEFANSIGMKFKIIPPGKFTMGSSQEEIERCLNLVDRAWGINRLPPEGPEHRVEITQPLYTAATEVTVAQFRQFVKEEGYRGADVRWRNRGIEQTDDHPAVFVSWNNAVDFCKWLSVKEGRTYRLLTEAEWEYSCRAGKSGTRYCYGDDDARLGDYAWYQENSGDGTHPVGKKRPNDWGLYDMHGNAFEWCQDYYDPTYYENVAVKDPMGAADGVTHVSRGGAWNAGPVQCRSARRANSFPQYRAGDLGFRVVLVVSPAAGVRIESGAKHKPSSPAVAPFSDADVRRIAALPAEQQVEEVRKELMRRNPGFDGKVEHKSEAGVVTELCIVTDNVTDIAPIRVFDALRALECRGTWSGAPNGRLADLTPLEGMNLAGLTQLDLHDTKVTDAGMVYFKNCKGLTKLTLSGTRVTDTGLAHFDGCKALTYLSLAGTRVTDAGLAPFEDCKNLTYLALGRTSVGDAGLARFRDCKRLTNIDLDHTSVSDAGLAYFKGAPLTVLWIDNTGVTDLSPLQGMALEHIHLTPKKISRGLEVLRGMKSLKTIGVEWDRSWPAAEFWERYDKGEFKE